MDTPIYTFEDGQFRFCTASFGSWCQDRRIVFRVRVDTTAKVRAAEKGITCFDRLLPSTQAEIEAWEIGHPTLRVER